MAFPSNGGVLVGDDSGAVRLFPNDGDGQSARNAPVGQTYNADDPSDLTQAGDSVYMTLYRSGKVIQLNGDGTYNQDIVTFSGQPSVDGLTVNPATDHLLAALASQDKIVDVDPAAHSVSPFVSVSSRSWPDGLTVSADGSTLYAAMEVGNYVEGFDLDTGAVVFGPVSIAGGPDGLVVGSGPLAGNLYVNCNNGTVVEVNLATGNQTPVATGGSRGDFAKMDPHDGSMLLTQTSQIERLSFPAGPATSFVVTTPTTVTAGQPFDVTVRTVDPFGHLAVGYTGTVHFVASNGASADYTFQAANMGQYTFTIVVAQAGTLGITGTDTVTGITGSTSFTVAPAAADHLLFLQQPSDTAAGQTISPVMVAVVDQYGNVETGDNSDTVTLSIGVNPGSGTLSGTLTVTVVNGLATFSDLTIDMAGVGYTLHATIGGSLPDIDSNPFNIAI